MERKCNDECPHFMRINNTDESGHGICGFSESYFPVSKDADCPIIPKPYTCGDCNRLMEDFACMTCEAEDSAYHGDYLCGGFIDKHEEKVKEAIWDWKIRGLNVDEKLNNIRKDVEEMYSKFIKKEG